MYVVLSNTRTLTEEISGFPGLPYPYNRCPGSSDADFNQYSEGSQHQ